MALLMVWVDPDMIWLMRRWQSNKMLCYIHTPSKSPMYSLSFRMFQYDDYTLIPQAHDAVYHQAA